MERDLVWEERASWGEEERAEWDRREKLGAWWCNSHQRHTCSPRECRSLRGGILLPCNVERDYAREVPGGT